MRVTGQPALGWVNREAESIPFEQVIAVLMQVELGAPNANVIRQTGVPERTCRLEEAVRGFAL